MTTNDTPLAPVTVSQETCLAAYGVSPSWYLRQANAGAFRTWRVGKLVLSLPSDFVAFLSTQPSGAREEDTSDLLGAIGARKAG